MYCEKCAKEIAEHSTVCPYCGQIVAAPEPAGDTGTAEGNVTDMQPISPKKSKKRVLLIVLSSVLILALIGGAVWFFMPKKQDYYVAKTEHFAGNTTSIYEYNAKGDILKESYNFENELGEEVEEIVINEYDEDGMLSSVKSDKKTYSFSYSETAEGYVGKSDTMEVKYDKNHRLTYLNTIDSNVIYTYEYYSGGQKKKEIRTIKISNKSSNSENTEETLIKEYNKQGELIACEEYKGSDCKRKITLNNCGESYYILLLFEGEVELKDGFIVSYKNEGEYGKYEQISEKEAELKIYNKFADKEPIQSIKMVRDGDEMHYDFYNNDGKIDKSFVHTFDRFGHLLSEKCMYNGICQAEHKNTWEKK
ncbi:MAG: hypothetical protein IKE65_05170 [Clostridia bacterium]|nr:hypothetical protein [Clostridia bacterium]